MKDLLDIFLLAAISLIGVYAAYAVVSVLLIEIITLAFSPLTR